MNRDRKSYPQRALFYTHDTVGLGHLRRTLLICQGIGKRFSNLSTLVVTGSSMAHSFRIPPGVDYVKLPCVTKLDNENYAAESLMIPFKEIRKMRQDIILQATKNFRPDFFFVDNVPLGMKGELCETLAYIRRELPQTRAFLNLRDIVDSASTVVPIWRRLGVFEALEKYYDRIFIYGQPMVFDPVTEYQIPPRIRDKTTFCGYLPRAVGNGRSCPLGKNSDTRKDYFVVVTVGGGSDGGFVVGTFLRALSLIRPDIPLSSGVLLGPEMDHAHAGRFMAQTESPNVRFLDFSDEPLSYLAAADLVVSMGGYNTVSEIISLGKRAVVIPRTHPRLEQLIRSQRLQELGFLKMIHPNDLTPWRLARQIEDSLRSPEPRPNVPLDFGALERLGDELENMTLRITPKLALSEGLEAVP